MSTGLRPDDVRNQADLANAMASIRTGAGMSFGAIAEKSSSSAGSRISKTTAKNLTTPGQSLPSEGSLRGFLRTCDVEEALVEEWCAALARLRFDGGGSRYLAVRQVTTPAVPLEGAVWPEMVSLALFNRVLAGDAAGILPAVRDLVEHSAKVLGAAYETGPAYTLHGVSHAIAVVDRLGELLGADVKKLNPHEAGLLVVAAFFHDVGRVPGLPVEISPVNVRRYLDQAGGGGRHLDEGSLTGPVLEDYCRWDRARRLDEYLKQMPAELLVWDGVPMREVLSVVCTGQARAWGEGAPPDRLPGVDLALCVSLLRLATRLELCSVRSARDIYRRLAIERRTEPRSGPDDLELRHHVRRLVLKPRRYNADYVVEAEAIMLRPVVEFDLRDLLGELQDEFVHCQAGRVSWSEAWRRLPLPNSIDLAGLKGIGYTYEKLSFELVRDDVLQLLGGTKLYGNPNVFVRELLQNAIDAVRLRQILDSGCERGSVAISSWEDRGAVWFRIDDNGTGMDMHTIREYFLQIGRSYYNSDELHRELGQLGTRKSRFSAISRFGIGVMSCFMLGDRIEVSTRKFTSHGERGAALRLSIDRQEDFATLRCGGQGHDPIPAGPGGEPLDFRETVGTTVAVRIDATRHYVQPKVLLDYAAYFHFTAECALTLNGVDHPGVELSTPVRREVQSTRNSFGKARSSPYTGRHLGRARVFAVPLDLTRHSPDSRVQGQLMAIVAYPPPVEGLTFLHLLSPAKRAKLHPLVRESLAGVPVGLEVSVSFTEVTLYCHLCKSIDEVLAELGVEGDLPGDEEELQVYLVELLEERHGPGFGSLDAQVLVQDRNGPIRFSESLDGVDLTHVNLSNRWWAHNGVTLPVWKRYEFFSSDNLEDDYREGSVEFSQMKLSDKISQSTTSVDLAGSVSFTDDLRPDLSLDRSELEAVPFEMIASLVLALRRAIAADLDMELAETLDTYSRVGQLITSFESVNLDSVLSAVGSVADGWIAEPVIPVGGAWETIARVVEMAESGEVILEFDERAWGYWPRLFTLIGTALAQRALNLRWSVSGGSARRGAVVALPGERTPLAMVMEFFPPLSFMCYESGSELRVSFGPWNTRHPLCSWFLSCGAELKDRMPGYFSELQEVFSCRSGWSLVHFARSREKRGLVSLADILEDYDERDFDSSDDAMTAAEVTQLTVALVRLVVVRIVAAAPDLEPSREVLEFLGL